MKKNKTILVLIGHPSKKSFSHKLAEKYAAGASGAGHSVEMLDIYSMNPQLPLLNYEEYSEWDKDREVRELYQAKITKADKIVMFHPLWWGTPPPLLKNFIDQTLTPGFAYKFLPRKFIPEALNILPRGYLKGKATHIFITFDGYKLVYICIGLPFITIWALFTLFFCGITNQRYSLHQRMRWSSETARNKWLSRAEKYGKKA